MVSLFHRATIITEEYHSCVAPTLDKGNVYVTSKGFET